MGISPYRSMRTASTSPRVSPASVPITPIHRPWNTNARSVSFRVSPIAFRIPISLVRLTTTITRVLTMLNAATSTISETITPMANFSSLSAEKSWRFVSVHGRTTYGHPPSVSRTDSATAAAFHGSSVRTPTHEATLSARSRRSCTSPIAAYPLFMSYSYMPVEKIPDTTHSSMRENISPLGLN